MRFRGTFRFIFIYASFRNSVTLRFADYTFDSKTGRPTIEYNGATYLYQYKAAKQLDDAGRKWKDNDRRFLYPLPKQELVLNKALNPQNPGWE